MIFFNNWYKVLSIFTLMTVFIFNACSSGTKIEVNPDYPEYKFGWIDENTYRVVGKGKPSSSKSKKIRRKSSKRSAVLYARNKILEKFKLEQKKNRTKPAKYRSIRKVKRIIRRGKILRGTVKYDRIDRCKIIYQIYSSDLKEKVKNSDFSSIEIIY